MEENVNVESTTLGSVINAIQDLCVRIDSLILEISSHSVSYNPRVKVRQVVPRKFKRPSKLVPDQTYTVRQLFDRAVVNSMPDDLARQYYAEDTNDVDKLFERSGIDLTTLDLVELDDYLEMVKNRIDEHKEKIRNFRKKQETPPAKE